MLRGRIITPHINSRNLLAEEVLMLAVFEQAFADLDSNCPAIRADAEAYFLAYRPDSSVFSLDAVCGQFGLSPAAIRCKVRTHLNEKGVDKTRGMARAA